MGHCKSCHCPEKPTIVKPEFTIIAVNSQISYKPGSNTIKLSGQAYDQLMSKYSEVITTYKDTMFRRALTISVKNHHQQAKLEDYLKLDPVTFQFRLRLRLTLHKREYSYQLFAKLIDITSLAQPHPDQQPLSHD